jgi:thiol-disulfide isomerase/thioredoxin
LLVQNHKFRFFWLITIALTGAWLFAAVIGSIAAFQEVTDLRASGGDLLAQDRGKVQVLIFVRSDCPIANRYAPLLQQMHQKYGPNVAFRLVFPDRNESQEKIRNYLREYHYDISAIRDLDHTLVKRAAAKVTPEAAVFDPNGQLIYHGRIDNLYEHIGQARRAATTHELADAIDAASKSLKPPMISVDAVGCFISDLE